MLQKHTNSVRIGVVHNVDMEVITTRRATGHLCMACAIDVALSTLDVGVAKMFVTKLVKEENVEALQSGSKTWDDLAVSVRLSVAVSQTFSQNNNVHVQSVLLPRSCCHMFCFLASDTKKIYNVDEVSEKLLPAGSNILALCWRYDTTRHDKGV